MLFLFALLSLASAAEGPIEQQFADAERLLRAGQTEKVLARLAAITCDAPDTICLARKASLAGNVHLFRGDYPSSLDFFQQALSLYGRLGDSARIIDLLNNLGTVHYYRGDYAAAYERYQAAESALRHSPGQPWFDSARHLTTANMATLHQRLGRYRQALDAYQSLGKAPKGLAIAERAQLLSNVAVLNRRLGDPWKARALLRQAASLVQPDSDTDIWLGIVKNLGIVLVLDFQEFAAARAAFSEALSIAQRSRNAREAMQLRLYIAETLFRSGEHDAAFTLWRRALADSRSLDTPEDEWRSLYGLARVHRHRGDVSRSAETLALCMATIEKLRRGIDLPSLRTEFLSDKSDVFEAALELAVARSDLALAFRTMERARSLAIRESLKAREITLPGFQKVLRADEAALLYHVGRANSYLLWVSPGEAGIERIEVPEQEIRRNVEELRRTGDTSGSAAITLSAALLAKVPVARRLWIVPDSVLAFLPFELLRHDSGLLIEQFETAYLPSAVYLRASQPSPVATARWPWETQVVAYADPDLRAAQLLPSDQNWSDLPESAAEVDAIAAVMPGRSWIARGAGIDASGLMERARSAPILHLATHAAADPEYAERNRLLIGPGYLFPSRLAPQSLAQLRLAVLSACDTDIGTLSRGEGAQSLARSFLIAGARATLASLWRVDDAATSLFMQDFYTRVAQGRETATALREVKLHFLKSNGPLSNPRYWAAFVLQGNSEAIPLPVRWSRLACIAAGLCALAAVACRSFSKKRSPGW